VYKPLHKENQSMNITWRPINPDDPQYAGNVVGTGKLNTQSVETGTQYTDLNVSTYWLDAATMAELNFSGIGDGSGKQNLAYFMLEVACYTSDVQVVAQTPNELQLQRSGVGFRLGIASWSATLSFNTQPTLAAISANVQLGYTNTNMKFYPFGIGISSLDFITPMYSIGTSLTPDVLKTVSECGASLADYMANNSDKVTAKPIAIAPLAVTDFAQTTPAPWFNSFISGQFSIASIWHDRNISDSLAAIANSNYGYATNVVPDLLRCVYGAFGIGDDFTAPSTINKNLPNTANTILSLGRF
jgi:hypothetical protein